jgi:hypothetical protein
MMRFDEHPGRIIFTKKESSAPFWQDKGTPGRTDTASHEPSYLPKMAQSTPKHHGSQKRQLHEVSGCVTDAVFQKLEIMRHAGQKNEESRSSYVGRFVTQGVERNGDLTYLSMIEPAIERVFDRRFKRFENRFFAIIARLAYQMGQVLYLLLNYLLLAFNNDEKILRKIEEKSRNSALRNITRRTPQIEEVIGRLKEERGETN